MPNNIASNSSFQEKYFANISKMLTLERQPQAPPQHNSLGNASCFVSN